MNNINQTNSPYPQVEMIDEQTKRPTRAWQQFFLNILNFTSAASATKGSANLPSNPQGFINVVVNGKPYKVPFYNP